MTLVMPLLLILSLIFSQVGVYVPSCRQIEIVKARRASSMVDVRGKVNGDKEPLPELLVEPAGLGPSTRKLRLGGEDGVAGMQLDLLCQASIIKSRSCV